MTPREKATLYGELAKLTDAAVHLDRSLELLIRQKGTPQRRQYVEGLRKGLQDGLSLADAVKQYNATQVTGLETALIEAGERSGKLGMCFNHLARYFAIMDEARRKARQAMIYPLILAHLAVLLPELPALIVAQEGEYPGRRIVTSLFLLWLLIFGAIASWRWISDRAIRSPMVDSFLNRLPLLGSARRHWALARFCQVSHACLLAALNMSATVRLAGQASQSGLMQTAAEKAVESILKGEAFAESLAESGAFESDFVHAIATAEEVGKIDEEMARWSSSEVISAHDAVDRAAQWLPKIGYAIVVVFVAYRIISTMQGIYSGMLHQFDA